MKISKDCHNPNLLHYFRNLTLIEESHESYNLAISSTLRGRPVTFIQDKMTTDTSITGIGVPFHKTKYVSLLQNSFFLMFVNNSTIMIELMMSNL